MSPHTVSTTNGNECNITRTTTQHHTHNITLSSTTTHTYHTQQHNFTHTYINTTTHDQTIQLQLPYRPFSDVNLVQYSFTIPSAYPHSPPICLSIRPPIHLQCLQPSVYQSIHLLGENSISLRSIQSIGASFLHHFIPFFFNPSTSLSLLSFISLPPNLSIE